MKGKDARQPVFTPEDDEPPISAPVFAAEDETPVEETGDNELIENEPEIVEIEPGIVAADPAYSEPQPTWEPIDTAPRDGQADFMVRWGLEHDAVTRVVRWKMGRFFKRPECRWVPGGRWIPTDNMEPLPADPPTHYWSQPKPETVEEEAA